MSYSCGNSFNGSAYGGECASISAAGRGTETWPFRLMRANQDRGSI